MHLPHSFINAEGDTMNGRYFFTSESVSAGHPDKMCDQISDAILDAIYEQDPNARVACETLTKTGMVVLAGEITTTAVIDYQDVVRKTIRNIGYDDPSFGFDADSCAVLNALSKQSPDICQGVSEGQGLHSEQGAGDQGIMFGYATNETPEFMPLPISLAHKLLRRLDGLRRTKEIPYLRPDAKSQVTIEYQDGKPLRVDTVVISTQHGPDVDHATITQDMISQVIKPVCGAWVDENTKYHINPTGRFVIGGPVGDAGLTGRKIIVDTYGGYGRHGGGAFSGKDPSKVDRSAAYMARYIAKNVVAAGLADKCEVQLSYAIGVPEPISIFVHCFGTNRIPEERLSELVSKHFPLKPADIIRELDLRRPIYTKTSAYGHFGRDEPEFTWERTDKAAILRQEAGVLQTPKAQGVQVPLDGA